MRACVSTVYWVAAVSSNASTLFLVPCDKSPRPQIRFPGGKPCEHYLSCQYGFHVNQARGRCSGWSLVFPADRGQSLSSGKEKVRGLKKNRGILASPPQVKCRIIIIPISSIFWSSGCKDLICFITGRTFYTTLSNTVLCSLIITI